jgi:hypothetical protein
LTAPKAACRPVPNTSTVSSTDDRPADTYANPGAAYAYAGSTDANSGAAYANARSTDADSGAAYANPGAAYAYAGSTDTAPGSARKGVSRNCRNTREADDHGCGKRKDLSTRHDRISFRIGAAGSSDFLAAISFTLKN